MECNIESFNKSNTRLLPDRLHGHDVFGIHLVRENTFLPCPKD